MTKNTQCKNYGSLIQSEWFSRPVFALFDENFTERKRFYDNFLANENVGRGGAACSWPLFPAAYHDVIDSVNTLYKNRTNWQCIQAAQWQTNVFLDNVFAVFLDASRSADQLQNVLQTIVTLDTCQTLNTATD